MKVIEILFGDRIKIVKKTFDSGHSSYEIKNFNSKNNEWYSGFGDYDIDLVVGILLKLQSNRLSNPAIQDVTQEYEAKRQQYQQKQAPNQQKQLTQETGTYTQAAQNTYSNSF